MAAATQPPISGLFPSHQLTPTQRREIIALCESVFDEDLSTLFESLGDSAHVLVWEHGALVAHACWTERWLQPEGLPPLRTAYIKAVAVAPERQRQGWGTLTMRRSAEAIVGDDLGALITVQPAFYTRLGWEQWRGPTAIRTAAGLLPTPGERPMILRTPRTPPLDLDALLTVEEHGGQH